MYTVKKYYGQNENQVAKKIYSYKLFRLYSF